MYIRNILGKNTYLEKFFLDHHFLQNSLDVLVNLL